MKMNDPGWTSVTISCSAQNSDVPGAAGAYDLDRMAAAPEIADRPGQALHRPITQLPPLARVPNVLEIAFIAL